jgi:hypothetical protein
MALDGYVRIEKSHVFLSPMATVDLFPTLRSLSRADKLKVLYGDRVITKRLSLLLPKRTDKSALALSPIKMTWNSSCNDNL